MSGYACIDLSTIVCNGMWARSPGALRRRKYPHRITASGAVWKVASR
jgi:hypothetical protein